MIRCYIVVAVILSVGWLSNDAYRYVTAVFHRAAVCDETKCLEIKQMATDLEGMKLPIKGDKR